MKLKSVLLSASAVLLGFAVGCHSGPPASATADAIYFGGPIVTVNPAQPSAEAVAIKDGKIMMVGARADIENAQRAGDKNDRPRRQGVAAGIH